MDTTYDIYKAIHLIFMVAWFAGLFYIFRLFVYHVQNKDKPEVAQVFQTMEKKLLYIIMHPAMALTLIFGFLMIFENKALLKNGWLHAKLTLIFLLVLYQVFCGIVYKRFKKGNFFLSEKACRLLNEVPTLVLIGAVLLAVLKPF